MWHFEKFSITQSDISVIEQVVFDRIISNLLSTGLELQGETLETVKTLKQIIGEILKKERKNRLLEKKKNKLY